MNQYSDYRNYYMSQFDQERQFKMEKSNNNLNFNLCNYNQKGINPEQLFDPYQGFIRGNLFPDLYNTYKKDKPYGVEPMNEQAKLLTYIDSLAFSLIDLNLYLDTHPDDSSMISLFNEYRKEKEKAMEEYERKYGPLTLLSESLNKSPWAWNNLPWPWEYR